MVGIYDDGRVLKIFFGIQSRQMHQIFIVVVRNSLSVLVYTTSENSIKKIILDCLMYKGQHGIIREMSKYLQKNKLFWIRATNTCVHCVMK